MSSRIREAYKPVPMGVDATLILGSHTLGGFMAVTSGTITIVATNTGTTVLDAFPVTLGVNTPLVMSFENGCTVTLGGGASGTLLT